MPRNNKRYKSHIKHYKPPQTTSNNTIHSDTDDENFLLTAAEKQAKQQQTTQTINTDNNTEPQNTSINHDVIPGYYYDTRTNKYYAITHNAPIELQSAYKQQKSIQKQQ